MNMKFIKIVDYLAWAVLVGVAIVIAVVVLNELEIIALSSLLAIGLAILRVVTFLYPIAILRYRIKTRSYAFLNKTVHYIALPLCLYIWVTSLL
jgi:hypothetical protein